MLTHLHTLLKDKSKVPLGCRQGGFELTLPCDGPAASPLLSLPYSVPLSILSMEAGLNLHKAGAVVRMSLATDSINRPDTYRTPLLATCCS